MGNKCGSSKGKLEYFNFKYEEKERLVLEETTLNEEQICVLNEIKKIWVKSKYEPIVEDAYKFWVKEYSPAEIADIYGKSGRLFQVFFGKCGLTRDRWEAQRIAKGKRDYKQIKLKGRQTMIENSTLMNGSSYEQYTRNLLNCRLPLKFPSLEIIVGLNNQSILSDGLEIDIPIIVIDNEKITKIAVEYDGDFWHKNGITRNIIKDSLSIDKGYRIFRIKAKENATDKQIKEIIDESISDIENYILLTTENVA